jgi:hypothetical protein
MEFFTSSKDPKFKHMKDQLRRQAKTKKADLSGYERLHYIETHADVISKILFIYAKLNAGVKYVQGMNEILATMYFCFYDVTMPQEYFLEYFESDLFFCFNTVVSEIRDSFVRTMDNEHSGINGKVAEFDFIMMKCDPELHAHLANEGLDP